LNKIDLIRNSSTYIVEEFFLFGGEFYG
jgi:hypothetical protein